MRYLVNGRIIKKGSLLSGSTSIVEDRVVKITGYRDGHKSKRERWFLMRMPDNNWRWFDEGARVDGYTTGSFNTLGDALYRMHECSGRVLIDDEEVHDKLFKS